MTDPEGVPLCRLVLCLRRLAGVALCGLVALCFAAPAGADSFSFSNSTFIAIPDVGVGSPYPSPILVSGITPNSATFVTVTIYGLTHTSIADVGMLLVGPGGQSVVLMDFVGSSAVDDATYTFDDAASDYLPFVGDPPSGTYRPTAYDTDGNIVAQSDIFDPPAPSSGYSSFGLSIFTGSDPNGVWNLYVEDFVPFDSGAVARGWSLTVTTPEVAEPSSVFLLGTGVFSLGILFRRRTGLGSSLRRWRLLWMVSFWILCTALTARAQTLTPLPGSPFGFNSPPAGQNSNIALLSVDGSHLFLSNQGSNTITVLSAATDGSLSFQGSYGTTPSFSANGMAANPAGDRLYVTTGDQTLNVHSIAGNGSLVQLQAADLGTPSSAENGVVYVSLPGGDFVYVNNNEIPNTVTSFPVLPDGTLATGSVVATGGDGFPLGLIASPRLLAGSDQRLYVLNEASDSISVFDIDSSSGNLTAVSGSPFVLPDGFDSSGAIAISSDATALYAATTDGNILQYAVDPSSGTLSMAQAGFTGVSDAIAGLTLDPSGSFLYGTLFLSQQIAVVDAATIVPVPNSPFVEDGASGPVPSYAADLIFNSAGTILFTADANSFSTQASSYLVNP